MLTEKSVRASDRRALFVGADAYEAAGGIVLRDLFQQDDGGWLEDVTLLETLVAEKLKAEAETIATEGWKWIEVAMDFPYGHTHGLRPLDGTPVDLTDEERASREALREEFDRLEAEYAEADELPERSRRSSKPSKTGRCTMIPQRSAVPAPSSAFATTVRCRSSAAMSVPRTKRQRPIPTRTMAVKAPPMEPRPAKADRSSARSSPSGESPRSQRMTTTVQSSRSRIG
jgi:hypothetical protein